MRVSAGRYTATRGCLLDQCGMGVAMGSVRSRFRSLDTAHKIAVATSIILVSGSIIVAVITGFFNIGAANITAKGHAPVTSSPAVTIPATNTNGLVLDASMRRLSLQTHDIADLESGRVRSDRLDTALDDLGYYYSIDSTRRTIYTCAHEPDPRLCSPGWLSPMATRPHAIADCANILASRVDRRVELQQAGQWYCVKTAEGNFAALELMNIPTAPAAPLIVQYQLLDK